MLFSKSLKHFSNQSIRRLFLTVAFFLIIISGFSQQDILGEKLTYSINYGWIKIGEAEIFIDPELKYVNDQPHYQIQCLVSTSSFIRLFKSINSCYESLINVNTGRPLVSHRNLKIGDDVDIRTNQFDHADSVTITAYIEDIDKNRYHSFAKEPIVLDFLSTYLFFRNLNFNDKKSIEIRSFYSNRLYDVALLNPRTKRTKWNGGAFPSTEFSIRFLRNELFEDQNHGKVIRLNDLNRTAVRIDFNMTLGKISFELEEVE